MHAALGFKQQLSSGFQAAVSVSGSQPQPAGRLWSAIKPLWRV